MIETLNYKKTFREERYLTILCPSQVDPLNEEGQYKLTLQMTTFYIKSFVEMSDLHRWKRRD
jgi:hypothetical protein